MAHLFVILKRSFVDAAISPLEPAPAVHFVGHPLASVATTIVPHVLPLTTNIIVFELPFVTGSVAPSKAAVPLLRALFVLALILGAVWPAFNSVSVLLVVLPAALVNRPIVVIVNSFPVCFVVSPLTLVDVAILVNESADSMVPPVDPLSFVEGSICPDLASLALANPQVFTPLADVNRTIRKSEWSFVNHLAHLCGNLRNLEGTQLLVDLVNNWVLQDFVLSNGEVEEATNCLRTRLEHTPDLFKSFADDVAPISGLHKDDFLDYVWHLESSRRAAAHLDQHASCWLTHFQSPPV